MIFSDNNSIFARIVGNNVNFRLADNALTAKSIKQNATNFIKAESKDEYLATLFRTSLKKQLQDQVNDISDLSKQQIRQNIPFIFNSQQVPDVFKTIAVAAALKIPVEQVRIQLLNISTVNDICDKMIENAIKNSDPTLNRTIEEYRKSALQIGIFSSQSRYLALDLFQTVMKKLKIYGQIVVNGHFLQVYGEKHYQNGRYFYNIIQIPHLQFQFNNSKLIVYEKIQGARKIIEPRDFTYQYMKSLLKGIQIIKNSGVMKSFNNYLLPQQQKADLSKFKQRYLGKINN